MRFSAVRVLSALRLGERGRVGKGGGRGRVRGKTWTGEARRNTETFENGVAKRDDAVSKLRTPPHLSALSPCQAAVTVLKHRVSCHRLMLALRKGPSGALSWSLFFPPPLFFMVEH